MMYEERQAIRRLHTTGMSKAAIAAALFLSKRQVTRVLAHPEDNNEAVTV